MKASAWRNTWDLAPERRKAQDSWLISKITRSPLPSTRTPHTSEHPRQLRMAGGLHRQKNKELLTKLKQKGSIQDVEAEKSDTEGKQRHCVTTQEKN